MTEMLKRAVRHLVTAITLLALTNCQVMDSTVTYQIRSDGSRVQSCNSTLGSYSLPYSTVAVNVYQGYQDGVKVGRPRLQVSDPEAHPDSSLTFCLDLLESATSDDQVEVDYYKEGSVDAVDQTQARTGLLSLITSKNVDETGEIIRNLLRAIFMLASGDGGFSFGRASQVEQKVMTNQAVNPFDLASLADLNKSLREYGYCLTFGKYTYDTSRSTADSYCNHPESFVTPPPYLRAARDQRYLTQKLPVGIYYRPRQPYQLFVYVRDDPDRGKQWELGMVNPIMLENLSPILSLGVNRTLFAERRSAFAFDRGNLVDACLAKGSEAQGAVEIPLDVIYGLVSLPATTINGEITRKTSIAGLLDAQRQVIEVQNKVLQEKAGSFDGADASATGKTLGDSTKFAPVTPLTASYGKIDDAAFGNFCQLIKGGT